jgi:4-hydroxymandelate synthase
MAVRGIEYVELYTNDKQPVVDYFTAAMGFTQIAQAVDHDRESALLRQGDAQLVVSAGPGTGDFLDAHGDGAVDVALTCDDVAASREMAVAAGAIAADSAPNPAVQAFGGVRHSLLPVAEGTGHRLPPGRSWTATAAEPASEGQIRLLDHVAVCLEGGTLSDYADFYLNAFGLDRYSSEYVDVGDNAMDSIVVRNQEGNVTFTLVAPDTKKGAGQLDAFLDRNGGPGVQHLAFLVDDIIPAAHQLRERGVEFLPTPGQYYDMLAERLADMEEAICDLRAAQVLADRDEWGYLLQVFTRSPHERRTLFYEFIQRRGARGFGSANIRALYEAVERDRLVAG